MREDYLCWFGNEVIVGDSDGRFRLLFHSQLAPPSGIRRFATVIAIFPTRQDHRFYFRRRRRAVAYLLRIQSPIPTSFRHRSLVMAARSVVGTLLWRVFDDAFLWYRSASGCITSVGTAQVQVVIRTDGLDFLGRMLVTWSRPCAVDETPASLDLDGVPRVASELRGRRINRRSTQSS